MFGLISEEGCCDRGEIDWNCPPSALGGKKDCMTALVLADLSLSQPVEDRFLIFDYRDCDHLMRLADLSLSQHSQATFPRQ